MRTLPSVNKQDKAASLQEQLVNDSIFKSIPSIDDGIFKDKGSATVWLENMAVVISKLAKTQAWVDSDWLSVVKSKISNKDKNKSADLSALLSFAKNDKWGFERFKVEFSKKLDPVSEKYTTHYSD